MIDHRLDGIETTGLIGRIICRAVIATINSPGPATFKILGLLSKKFRKACNSFDGDTLVAAEFGLKPIKDIQIGEKVWAFNEETGENSLQEIMHLIQGEGTKNFVDIKLVSGELTTATAGHPFYVQEKKGWPTEPYLRSTTVHN